MQDCAKIIPQNQVEFHRLAPRFEGFHMAKAAEKCIRKLFQVSGLDDAIVETKVFGVEVGK